MRVLAIETSCDETAAAVVEGPRIRYPVSSIQYRVSGIRVLSSIVASQADLHARTAGVVPEIAARAHVEAITFVIDDALRAAGLEVRGAQHRVLDAVAATTEPGLRPALVIGEAAARALAVAWGKPLIPVNHLAGHVAAAWLLRQKVGGQKSAVGAVHFEHRFPVVVLIVSGGHTQLWRLSIRESDIVYYNTSASSELQGGWHLSLLGQTRDDAAGEAFDKIARLLGLPYPGGAALAQLAEMGDAREFSFPRPMVDSGDLDFSFSGLKTAVYYTVRKLTADSLPLTASMRANLAASAQEAIVDVLVAKTVEAAAREGAAEVILTGGVAANQRLRRRLREALGGLPLIVPDPQYCTDNAAMIGAAAVLGVRLPSGDRETAGR